MSTDVDRLLHDAMALPERDRAELAGRLLESLKLGSDEVEESWHQEITRRITELDQGVTVPVPGAEARRIFRGAVNDPRS